jgi:DNA invertase Pin-like site-specific DNA recombinase
MVKVITKYTAPPLKRLYKNVAVYCRVSTLQEIQHNSLEAQRSYYEKYIASHPEWRLVEIYADQASGRNNKKMDAFQRMMADCRVGKIDFILIKSISRMGRNTVEFLKACSELNRLGVEVFFEVEKVYASDPRAVRMLTIFAGLYQNESEAKSFAIAWGHRVRFADGSSKMANRICYGYEHNENGELVPVPQEAEVVRMIYAWHDQGWSLRKISAELQRRDILSPRGKAKWGIETIRKILQNQKYHGDVMLQKTYVANFFTGRQAINKGEYAKYLISEHHEAIIEFGAKGEIP